MSPVARNNNVYAPIPLESVISNGTLFYDGVPKWTRHKEKKENFFFATNP